MNSPYLDFIYRMHEEPTQEQIRRRQDYLDHRDMRYREEYKLIQQKKSKLSSMKRKAIVEWYERTNQQDQ